MAAFATSITAEQLEVDPYEVCQLWDRTYRPRSVNGYIDGLVQCAKDSAG